MFAFDLPAAYYSSRFSAFVIYPYKDSLGHRAPLTSLNANGDPGPSIQRLKTMNGKKHTSHRSLDLTTYAGVGFGSTVPPVSRSRRNSTNHSTSFNYGNAGEGNCTYSSPAPDYLNNYAPSAPRAARWPIETLAGSVSYTSPPPAYSRRPQIYAAPVPRSPAMPVPTVTSQASQASPIGPFALLYGKIWAAQDCHRGQVFSIRIIKKSKLRDDPKACESQDDPKARKTQDDPKARKPQDDHKAYKPHDDHKARKPQDDLKTCTPQDYPSAREQVATEMRCYQRIAADLPLVDADGTNFKADKKFLMELFAVLQDKYTIGFVMPAVEYSLLEAIKTRPTERNTLRWIAQVMMGVRVLHSLGIIHRDIKPENIFLDTQHNFARIGEFSRALLRPAPLTNKDGCSSECVGTRQYTAPEIIGGAEYGRMVDWWSVGCLLFEMITGQVLFQEEKWYKEYINLASTECREEYLRMRLDMSRARYDEKAEQKKALHVLVGFLDIDPQTRLEYNTVLELDFFLLGSTVTPGFPSFQGPQTPPPFAAVHPGRAIQGGAPKRAVAKWPGSSKTARGDGDKFSSFSTYLDLAPTQYIGGIYYIASIGRGRRWDITMGDRLGGFATRSCDGIGHHEKRY
ncbi:predicted protein [Postia placenta Mad-698-R]|nr:predicted protein [Postia placenta Mad-698-R]